MKKFVSRFFLLLMIVHTNCSHHLTISTRKPLPYPSVLPAGMIAGIGQADLTPPPGYPMAGYSINGRISRGYWIRPKATALYMRDEAGTPFVFVTTDLWAITDGQKLGVLDTLSKNPATQFIGESELLLAATHSHQSLGVNVPDDAFSASSIGFGFDRQAFDFTVGQIASAIRMAIDSAQPALVSFAVDTVRGIAKNRSVASYLRNHPEERKQFFNREPALHQIDVTREEIESMIDPRLTLITVKDLAGRIKGILASYPVHPTATGDATEVYSADIFGLASAYASRDHDHPIVAFYNGAEGDVAPYYLYHNRYDAVRMAEKLSQAILKTSRAPNQIAIEGKISHRTNTIDMASNKVPYDPLDGNCYCRLPDSLVSTAKNAMVGATVFAGASDGRTSLSSFGISDAVKGDKWDPKQGYKKPAVEFLVTNVLGNVIKRPFRTILKAIIKTKTVSRLPISIHEVGPIRFVGLPGEFTTMLGRRIKRTIAARLATQEGTISLVGLADAYISYVTTPCEYNEQAYEGASDYFGMSSGQVLVKEYEKLARRAEDRMQDRQGRETRFRVGVPVRFGPSHLERLQTWNAEERLQNLLFSANGTKLRPHVILPDVLASDTSHIGQNEAAVYSFDDTVNGIGGNKNFYPGVALQTVDGDSIPVPEYILTVDKYSQSRITWTVRILDISKLPDCPVQIVISQLSNIPAHYSAFFCKE